MGYVFATSPCICCRRVFSYTPHKGPSTTAFTGSREPVCRSCMGVLNDRRQQQGLEPFEIQPDAYDPLPEEEL
jgi:hypothetical protein